MHPRKAGVHVALSASCERRCQRGQAFVEFALVLPIMLLILLIAADFGRLFFSYVQVTNAAREGANYASLHAADSPFDLAAYVSGAANAANGEANVQGQRGEGGLTVDAPVCFSPLTPSSPINCGTASDFAGGIGNYVTVTVREDFAFLTPMISGFFGTLPLTASSTAPVLNPPVAPPTLPPPPTPGSLVITKVLEGDLTDFRGGDFTFAISCNGQSYGPVTIDLASGTGSSNPITGIPAGAVCTVTETDQPNAGAHASWDAPGAEQATITEGGQARVTITNTRTYTAPTAGSLVVTKALAGDLTGFAGGDFTFDVSCDGQPYGPVRINLASSTGSSNPITGIPEGADCTVNETDRPDAGSNASWVGSMGTTTVTIQKSKQADAVITNTRSYTAPCTDPRVTVSPVTTVAGTNKQQIRVDFTGTAAGTPTSWEWTFDDGSLPVPTQNVTHTFTYTLGKGSGPQIWTATLTTTGSCPGSATATVTLDWQ